MRNFAACVLIALNLAAGNAQAPFEQDHRHYLELLSSAKDSLYNSILSKYDDYIAAHPMEYAAQLERCKLIEKAFYDSYEDYNPNYEEAEACASDLSDQFPNAPEVLLYRADFLYGDSLQLLLKELESRATVDPGVWKDHEWEIYSRFAAHYQYQEGTSTDVIHYANLAMAQNDTLDLSLMLAKAYQETDHREKAIAVLLEGMDSTDDSWQLNQKGTELLALGKADDAMRAFRWAAVNGEEIEGVLAKALLDNGMIEDARPHLLSDYMKNQMWRPEIKLRALLDYDLKYGSADSAVANYRKLTQDAFLNDPFGVYRLRLFAKSPLAGWSFADLGRLLLLVLVIAMIFVIPYLWILPMHYLGQYRGRRGASRRATFNWGLRDLWVASALWLACNLLVFLFFYYDAVLATITEQFVFAEDEKLPVALQANANLFFLSSCAVFCFGMVKNESFKGIWDKINARAIWTGVALAFGLRFLLGLVNIILGKMGVDLTAISTVASASTEILTSINGHYGPWLGFIMVVLVVPIYEEILFRGIFLSAAQRNLSFVVANSLQAFVFAAVHGNLLLTPFYFAFGMIAGHYTRKTASLATPMSMHATNNFLAFIGVLAATA